ncbi:hypothetical protein V6N13_106837 [Hibiscus sabdariffa]
MVNENPSGNPSVGKGLVGDGLDGVAGRRPPDLGLINDVIITMENDVAMSLNNFLLKVFSLKISREGVKMGNENPNVGKGLVSDGLDGVVGGRPPDLSPIGYGIIMMENDVAMSNQLDANKKSGSSESATVSEKGEIQDNKCAQGSAQSVPSFKEKLLVKKQKPDIVVIMEPRCSQEVDKFI